MADFSMLKLERGKKLKVKFMEDVKKIGLVIYTSLSLYQLHFGNIIFQTPQELWAQ